MAPAHDGDRQTSFDLADNVELVGTKRSTEATQGLATRNKKRSRLRKPERQSAQSLGDACSGHITREALREGEVGQRYAMAVKGSGELGGARW